MQLCSLQGILCLLLVLRSAWPLGQKAFSCNPLISMLVLLLLLVAKGVTDQDLKLVSVLPDQKDDTTH